MNYQRFSTPAVLSLLLIAMGCSDSIDRAEDYSVSESCMLNTGEAPPVPNLPAASDSAIDSDAELWSAIGLDNTETEATRITGSIPAPAIDAANSLTFAMADEIIVADRSRSVMPLTPQSIPAGKRVGAYLLQFEGIEEYMVLPAQSSNEVLVYGPQTNSDDAIRITAEYDAERETAGIKLNVRIYLLDEGETLDIDNPEFGTDADKWMYPEKEKIAAEGSTDGRPALKPQALGGGAIQMTLQWNQANDIDFWVVEPDGNIINYPQENRNSSSNPITDPTDPDYFNLDRDDVDGYGAENIRYPDLPMEGTYQVRVNKYAGDQNTTYYLSVRACGETVFLRGYLDGGDVNASSTNVDGTHLALSFTVEGDTCSLALPQPRVSEPDFIEAAAVCDIPSKDYVIIGDGESE